MTTFVLFLILALVLLCTQQAALAGPKARMFLEDAPTIDQRLPVKAATTIHAGAYLEWTAGAVDPVSGAGNFAGIAMESAVGGAADGDVDVLVRVLGVLREKVVTDTTSASIVGVAATVPEATDDDTIRIETGSAITGTAMGKFMRANKPYGVAGQVDISFIGVHVA